MNMAIWQASVPAQRFLSENDRIVANRSLHSLGLGERHDRRSANTSKNCRSNYALATEALRQKLELSSRKYRHRTPLSLEAEPWRCEEQG